MTILTGEYWQPLSTLWIKIYWLCNVDKHQNTDLVQIKGAGWSLHVESVRQYTRGIKAELVLSLQEFPIWNNKGSLSHSSSEWPGATSAWGKGKCITESTGSSVSHRKSVDAKPQDAPECFPSRRQLLAAANSPMDSWRKNSALSRITAWGISRGRESCSLRNDCKFLSWLVPGDENEEELWLLSMNISEDQQWGKRQFKLKGYWQKYKWV